MENHLFFGRLTSNDIASLIRQAKCSVCFAGPGVQLEVAKAMVDVVSRLGPEMFTVCLDFDERVMRMGYGCLDSVSVMRDAGIAVLNAPGLRTALVIVDDIGFVYTPTPLYLEAEPLAAGAHNAIRMSDAQRTEALARLSPAAKVIAVAQATSPEEKTRIESLSVEVDSSAIEPAGFADVAQRLRDAPPVRFDLARQVRVFEPYLQYVELSLSGAAIQRHRLAIPQKIQQLGGSADLEGRLRTTFELIERGGKLSSKPLEDALNDIRKDFTPSLGKDHGRVVLKAAKPYLLSRLQAFREKLERHQKAMADELQNHLDTSRQQIIDHYFQRVIDTPPDALRGQLLSPKPTEQDARRWLNSELDRVFPCAEVLIQSMKLNDRFKDVTFETLNQADFLDSVKLAFPAVNWEKAYAEFRAAGEGSETTENFQ